MESEIESTPRAYRGVDRGFLFVKDVGNFPWSGLTSVDYQDSGGRLERYYIDGVAYFKNHLAGNFACSVTSLSDPFHDNDVDLGQTIFGFSFRENFICDGEEHYRLHLVYGLTMVMVGSTVETVTYSGNVGSYSWTGETIPVDLDGAIGSHIILDSTLLYPWVLHDIEAFLYGPGDGLGTPPSLETLYEFLETMNFIVIDHGDGRATMTGHSVMLRMLDATECLISSPTVEFHEDPRTFDIESLIRIDRWQE